jgi:MYXO-CTERM domain-containing protein
MRRLVPGFVTVAAILEVSFLGCVEGPPPDLAERRAAVGEPMNGFPTAAERLGIMAINRARSDPQTVAGPMSMSYPARPPVLWSYELSRSARFHAVNLQLSDVTLMHSSPCPLNTDVATTGCSGDPACACATPVPTMCASCAKVDAVNTCGTATFTRVGYFTAGSSVSATGEVAAAGYADPMAVVDGWMDEAAGSDGHRKNLTDQGITSNVMGYGHSQGSGSCYSSFDVSDSGMLRGAQIPKLPTAAVRPPRNSAAGSYVFYATWADPSLGAPSSLNVVVDGACTAMMREMGTDTLNATYTATVTLAAGCHNYYVAAVDASGAASAFPTTGAISIPVAGTACASDYLASAPASACSSGNDAGTPPATGGATGQTGSGGAAGGVGGRSGGGAGGATASSAGGATGQTGSGGATASGAVGGAPGGSGGAPGAGGSTTAPPKTGDTVVSGCSCAAAPGHPPARAVSLGAAAAALALLAARRRRRAPVVAAVSRRRG